MAKTLTPIVLVNAFLGFAYVISSYFFWDALNNWYKWNMQTSWTPFWVYPHRIPNMSTVEMPVFPMLNYPFIIFCIIIVTNLAYLLVVPRLQKWASKDV